MAWDHMSRVGCPTDCTTCLAMEVQATFPCLMFLDVFVSEANMCNVV